jgi:hypothetical protein
VGRSRNSDDGTASKNSFREPDQGDVRNALPKLKKYFRIIRNCDFLTASRLGKRDVSADRHDTWGGEAVAVMPAPDERKSSRR